MLALVTCPDTPVEVCRSHCQHAKSSEAVQSWSVQVEDTGAEEHQAAGT